MTGAGAVAAPTGLAPPVAERLARLWTVLPRARLVGGVVRDTLAGRPVADIDLATPDTPDETARLLAGGALRVVPTGLAHGTLTAVVDGVPFEVTTLRRDVATDGRHATVAYTDDWRLDASRRDFTINAMFRDRDGVVHDFFDGARDLASCRVRFVGEASRRIAEDHLRILRFFRFHARFGGPTPDGDALAAIASGRELLRCLSPERVWSELRRLFAVDDPRAALDAMDRTGVLAILFGPSLATDRLAALLATDAPADPSLRLVAITDEATDALAVRLRLSNAEARRIGALRDVASRAVPSTDDAAARRLLADATPALARDATYLAAACQTVAAGAAVAPEQWARLRERLAAVTIPVFPIGGRDAVALGAPPGPAVGAALDATRAWWLAGGAIATRDACLRELGRRLGLSPP